MERMVRMERMPRMATPLVLRPEALSATHSATHPLSHSAPTLLRPQTDTGGSVSIKGRIYDLRLYQVLQILTPRGSYLHGVVSAAAARPPRSGTC